MSQKPKKEILVEQLEKLTGKKVVLKSLKEETINSGWLYGEDENSKPVMPEKMSALISLLHKAGELSYDVARENLGKLDWTKPQVKDELMEIWANLYGRTLGESKSKSLKEYDYSGTPDNATYKKMFQYLQFAANLSEFVKREEVPLTGLHKEDILEQLNKLWNTLFSETLTTH